SLNIVLLCKGAQRRSLPCKAGCGEKRLTACMPENDASERKSAHKKTSPYTNLFEDRENNEEETTRRYDS
ncbi:hypothetical protein AB6D08_25925, partial [Vibrio splendidus]